MKIVEAGHTYLVDSLDGGGEQTIRFVKREGDNFPFNLGSHSGTNVQEVLRCLIDRTKYLLGQKPCAETEAALGNLQSALLHYENRAARRHGRLLDLHSLQELVCGTPCRTCGHLGCTGHAVRESGDVLVDNSDSAFTKFLRDPRTTRAMRLSSGVCGVLFKSVEYIPSPFLQDVSVRLIRVEAPADVMSAMRATLSAGPRAVVFDHVYMARLQLVSNDGCYSINDMKMLESMTLSGRLDSFQMR